MPAQMIHPFREESVAPENIARAREIVLVYRKMKLPKKGVAA